jgi:predicted naringenin-chalcone synthase
VLTAFGASVGLDRAELDVSRDILSEYGNMSSATLLFILERLRATEAQTPCVAVAFGPGLVAEVALIL